MYYPLPFEELLDECPYRVAGMSQIEKWLQTHQEYYEWCTTIWSLTELETASEEYAFTCIYERFSELYQLHQLEPRIRAITEEYPGGGPENPEVWKWYKKHEKFYDEYLLFFQSDYQNYELHLLGKREHLTVPMACFRENEIYVDKEDFLFVFDLVEIYDPLTYTPVPDSVAENPEYADFIQFLQNDADAPDTEACNTPEREEELEEEDIIGKSALQRLMNFHETMIDFQELEEWVEQHAHVKKRLEDNHQPFCGCRICNDFTTLWFDMSNIVNAYQKKEAFRRFSDAYEASEKDMESLARIFLKNYPLVKSLYIPDGINVDTKGIVVYYNAYSVSERLRFVFVDESWSSIYTDLPWFSGMMNAMYFYLLDRFNAENKSFYLRYDFEKICAYFGKNLIDEVAYFFEINYEIAARFPDALTPEGKFLY